MPSPAELAALRANVLGAFEDYSRLRALGQLGSQLPEIRSLGSGFTLEDKGAAFLCAMLNEFFVVSPDKNVYVTALGRVNNFVDREKREGGRAWGLVRSRLLEIGRQRGWSTTMVRREPAKQRGGCYVATAVYGSYDCPEVRVLRHFRDQTLVSTSLGRSFIRVYYAVSPLAVRLGGAGLRAVARRPLGALVQALRSRGYSDAPH